MIIPQILPGELGVGYLVRFAKINGYQSKKIALRNLKEKYGISAENITPNTPTLLSRALNISIQQYIKYHTPLPVLRGVTNFLPNILHGDPKHQAIINSHAARRVDVFKSCDMCTEEDINYHGFIYYRTEHQFPGYDFCSKHKHGLNNADGDYYVTSDKDIVNQSKNSSPTENYATHEVINRYRSIIDSLATSTAPIPLLKLVLVMQTQARLRNISWSKKTTRKLLSDLVLDLLPKPWVEALIPKFASKVYGKYLGNIDCLLTPQIQAGRTCLYAIILSVLYEDADTALNDINRALTLQEKVISKSIRIDQSLKENNRIKNAYISKKGHLKDISKEMGVSSSSARKALAKQALMGLTNIRRNIKDALLDFEAGIGLIESCIKNNVKLTELDALLRKLSNEQANAIRSIDSANLMMHSQFTLNIT